MIIRYLDFKASPSSILAMTKKYNSIYPNSVVRITLKNVGLRVTIVNTTLKCFLFNGTMCHRCGLEGKYFVLEKNVSSVRSDSRYSLTLYGINEDGEEVLMTKDHKVRVRDGGDDRMENLQTLCVECNVSRN